MPMTTPHNHPPTSPAVTDEMVETAIWNYRASLAAWIRADTTDGRTAGLSSARAIALSKACDTTYAELRALIARALATRARTPETATPVPGRLHANKCWPTIVLNTSTVQRFAKWGVTDENPWRDSDVHDLVAECKKAIEEGRTTATAALEESPPAPAPKPGPDLDALLKDTLRLWWGTDEHRALLRALVAAIHRIDAAGGR